MSTSEDDPEIQPTIPLPESGEAGGVGVSGDDGEVLRTDGTGDTSSFHADTGALRDDEPELIEDDTAAAGATGGSFEQIQAQQAPVVGVYITDPISLPESPSNTAGTGETLLDPAGQPTTAPDTSEEWNFVPAPPSGVDGATPGALRSSGSDSFGDSNWLAVDSREPSAARGDRASDSALEPTAGQGAAAGSAGVAPSPPPPAQGLTPHSHAPATSSDDNRPMGGDDEDDVFLSDQGVVEPTTGESTFVPDQPRDRGESREPSATGGSADSPVHDRMINLTQNVPATGESFDESRGLSAENNGPRGSSGGSADLRQADLQGKNLHEREAEENDIRPPPPGGMERRSRGRRSREEEHVAVVPQGEEQPWTGGSAFMGGSMDDPMAPIGGTPDRENPWIGGNSSAPHLAATGESADRRSVDREDSGGEGVGEPSATGGSADRGMVLGSLTNTVDQAAATGESEERGSEVLVVFDEGCSPVERGAVFTDNVPTSLTHGDNHEGEGSFHFAAFGEHGDNHEQGVIEYDASFENDVGEPEGGPSAHACAVSSSAPPPAAPAAAGRLMTTAAGGRRHPDDFLAFDDDDDEVPPRPDDVANRGLGVQEFQSVDDAGIGDTPQDSAGSEPANEGSFSVELPKLDADMMMFDNEHAMGMEGHGDDEGREESSSVHNGETDRDDEVLSCDEHSFATGIRNDCSLIITDESPILDIGAEFGLGVEDNREDVIIDAFLGPQAEEAAGSLEFESCNTGEIQHDLGSLSAVSRGDAAGPSTRHSAKEDSPIGARVPTRENSSGGDDCGDFSQPAMVGASPSTATAAPPPIKSSPSSPSSSSPSSSSSSPAPSQSPTPSSSSVDRPRRGSFAPAPSPQEQELLEFSDEDFGDFEIGTTTAAVQVAAPLEPAPSPIGTAAAAALEARDSSIAFEDAAFGDFAPPVEQNFREQISKYINQWQEAIQGKGSLQLAPGTSGAPEREAKGPDMSPEAVAFIQDGLGPDEKIIPVLSSKMLDVPFVWQDSEIKKAYINELGRLIENVNIEETPGGFLGDHKLLESEGDFLVNAAYQQL